MSGNIKSYKLIMLLEGFRDLTLQNSGFLARYRKERKIFFSVPIDIYNFKNRYSVYLYLTLLILLSTALSHNSSCKSSDLLDGGNEEKFLITSLKIPFRKRREI